MSARDVIDLTLFGQGYDRTEGTSDAILAALTAAGLVVVPITPTRRMLDLAWTNGDENACSVWAAMIAAAAQEPSHDRR